jgi:hypothetical protein
MLGRIKETGKMLQCIPNAQKSFGTREPPFNVLHVVTDLMHFPQSPGFDPEAHDAMMRVVGLLVGPRCEFDKYKIHAADHP